MSLTACAGFYRHPNGQSLYYRSPDGVLYYHDPALQGWVSTRRLVGVGDIFSDAGNWINTAVNDAGKWVSDACQTMGKAIESGLDAIGKAFTDFGNTLKSIPFVGGFLGAIWDFATDPITLPLGVADAIAHGKSPWTAVVDTFGDELNKLGADAKAIAPLVESVISFVPGIGPVCSMAIAGAVAIAEGEPIDEAVVDIATAGIPGGPIIRAAYNAVRSVIAHKGAIDWSTLADATVSGVAGAAGVTLPPEVHDLTKAAVTLTADLANGKSVPQSAFDSLSAGVPEINEGMKTLKKQLGGIDVSKIAFNDLMQTGDKIMHAVQGTLPKNKQSDFGKAIGLTLNLGHAHGLQQIKRTKNADLAVKMETKGAHDISVHVKAARNASVGHGGGKGFNIGHGLVGFHGDKFQTTLLRNSLTGADRTGFDIALAFHVGRVCKPLPTKYRSNTKTAAGFYIGAGTLIAPASVHQSIQAAIVKDPEVHAGMVAGHNQASAMETVTLIALGVGLLAVVAGTVAYAASSGSKKPTAPKLPSAT